ncbi:MAG: tetratricopeptide repeat protein [Candidatus Kaelpia aquatica]|nr:tetratricopeptide repeat protein [Candidatus Kaelpia aquatica]
MNIRNSRKFFGGLFLIVIVVIGGCFFIKTHWINKEEQTYSCYIKGEEYYSKEELDAAIRGYQKSIILSPEFYQGYYMIGRCYFKKGEYEEAISYLKKTLEIKPDYSDAHYLIAVVYAKRKLPQVDLAREHYDIAVHLGYAPPKIFTRYLENLEEFYQGD